MTGSLDAQTVRDALTDATAWVDGTAQLASVEAALEALDGLVASVEALTEREADALKAFSLAAGGSDFTTRVIEMTDDSIGEATEALDKVGVAGDLLLGDRVKVLIAEFHARGDRLIAAEASVEALTSENAGMRKEIMRLGEQIRLTPRLVEWGDLAPSAVERERRLAAEARVVALTAERDALERLVRRAVDEGLDGAGFWESSARSYLTSSRAAAKVPPVQAAPDSPREDASAPEGTAT